MPGASRAATIECMRLKLARRRALGGATVVLLGLALVPISSAFTASNTGGEGAAAVSGYSVSNIRFVATATDPAKLAEVSFAIAPATATTVSVQLRPGSAWYACQNASGAVVCPTPAEPAVASATSLDVVAYK
jgi:hypothetical protein